MDYGSREVARAAIGMSITKDRDDERAFKERCAEVGIRCAAVDFGGAYTDAPVKVVERAVVAAKREGLIEGTHIEEGAVAGAAHDAVSQLISKAFGLNVGGKVGMARYEDHIAVAVFFGVGLLHLNDVALGIGHRAI